MNTNEAAETLGVSPRELRMFLRNTFRAVGSGNCHRFAPADLPTLREELRHWKETGKPDATRPTRDEAVWSEDGPVLLEDLSDPEVRNKVRRIAAEQEALLELRLLAAGLHITQRA
ncbi:helix-turn-helix domain-containing protein [Micromonospora violae]|nr:helix-turn-helix domain-containing protein [Micromonospora violae]